ncbi:DUF2062 domain-containing protein [Deltaproteobacteria bacterium TL4]
MKNLIDSIYDHIIAPIIHSVAPVPQVSWGVAIGTFVGLTPTMGIQMYISFLIWSICRYVFRFNFNLPVAVAMVWITNPITVIPVYYVFLLTGNCVLRWLEFAGKPLSYEHFKSAFEQIAQLESSWAVVVEGTRFLLVDLGFPMMIGGLCYALPSAVISFFLTQHFLLRYRKYKAAQLNMDYEEWRRTYESSGTKKNGSNSKQNPQQ